jgi:hypothetical protein
MARRTRLFLSSLALAAFASVHAAELGDPRVSSHIGQPLVADVELTLLDDPSTPVQVRVASPEVYNGAGIAMPPVLASLNLSVMRRDGRQFLHVTSLRPVDADHVHLYLELVDKGQRGVRLATLWLTPDPTPVAALVASPAPAPARVAAPAPAPLSEAALLAQVERARAARAAAAVEPAAAPAAPRVPVKRPHPAPVAKAPVLPVAQPDAHPPACARPAAEAQACAALGAKNDELRARLGQVEDRMKKLQGALAAPVVAKPPAGSERKDGGAKAESAHAELAKPETAKDARAQAQVAKPEPVKAVQAHTESAKPEPVKAAPAHTDSVKPEPLKAAQADSAKPEPAKDAKPAPAAPKPAPAIPPAPAKPVVPAGPRPIHSIKPLVAHTPKAPPPDDGLPWGWIGAVAGVLALGGAGAFVVVRRRRAGAGGAGPLARLRARFAARAGKAQQAAEPTLD